VTQYTSYLITEDDILTQSGRDEAAVQAEADMAAAPTSGAESIEYAQDAGDMERSDLAVPAPSADGDASGGGSAGQVAVVGSRTFLNQDGVWTETTFDPSTMATTTVVFASDDYFALLDTHPDLAEAFALGDHVIAISAGTAYEVVPA
jgi:hypothetical protein